MIGRIIEADAFVALRFVEAAIARDHGAIRQAHDQRGVVAAAVRIDQQPRITGHQRRHGEPLREHARERRGADVVGDVARHLRLGKPERAVARGKGVASVIAQDHEAGIGPAGEYRVALVLLGADDPGLCCLERHGPTIVAIGNAAKQPLTPRLDARGALHAPKRGGTAALDRPIAAKVIRTLSPMDVEAHCG